MKNGKLTATNGTDTGRVQLFHWWPGRQYAGTSPIPPSLVREAERIGSRYLTFAVAELPQGPVAEYSLCCPKDMPDRAMGRRIALGRLASALEPMGWRVE